MSTRSSYGALILTAAFAVASVLGAQGIGPLPYPEGYPRDASDIDAVRSAASRARTSDGYSSTVAAAIGLGVEYCAPNSDWGTPSFWLSGVDSSGKPDSVCFSEIRSLGVRKYRGWSLFGGNRQAQVDVDCFPLVSSVDLMQSETTSTSLDSAGGHIQLWMDLKDSRGYRLCLVAKSYFQELGHSGEYDQCYPLEKFSANKLRVVAGLDQSPLSNEKAWMIWWATPAVVRDPAIRNGLNKFVGPSFP